MGYQWQNLLLEAGFLSIFLTPFSVRLKGQPLSGISLGALWLIRILLFKLMFSSGIVKLSSGDETWKTLTALNHHYETTPIATWTSWYFHQAPEWFQKVSTLIMFFGELVAPFFIFAPRRLRHIGFWILLILQALIAGTGNYAYFNLLAMVLCITLLDDHVWLKGLKNKRKTPIHDEPGQKRRPWSFALIFPIAFVFLTISTVQMVNAFRTNIKFPKTVIRLYRVIAPFRTVNGYGLFASMTTTRPEITIEGSQDGKVWRTYEFK